MPRYVTVDLAFEPFSGPSQVFAHSKQGFSSATLGKTSTALDRSRQDFFEAQLDRLAATLGSQTIPVWIHWSTGERLRMDKGCIGHAVARGKLFRPTDNTIGVVETVVLRG